MNGAVAVDLGATSGRYAFGELRDGRIVVEMGERILHSPTEVSGRETWDLAAIAGLVDRAASAASTKFGRATLGIDAWGVDHGFLDVRGELVLPPVAYRDASHADAFERLREHRAELYALTGIQAQPFNTVYQLVARRELAARTHRWLPLPDLLAFLTTGEANVETTQASTSNLQGLDGAWSPRAFEIAGWPVPDLTPRAPGELGGYVTDGVRIATVGSHDTASAVAGLGTLTDSDLFLNVGTWSLVGTVVDRPIATPEAEAANLSNERTVDGRVRLLRNVPGFWVINRLHEELGVPVSVPEWLASGRREHEGTLDLFDDALFNPDSMVAACGSLPLSPAGWAELALRSLVEAIAAQVPVLASVTGRSFRRIRVAGGGSASVAFCEALASRTGLTVDAGPTEATVLGNLAMQFLAQGRFSSLAEMFAAVDASAERRVYA